MCVTKGVAHDVHAREYDDPDKGRFGDGRRSCSGLAAERALCLAAACGLRVLNRMKAFPCSGGSLPPPQPQSFRLGFP